MSGMRFQLGPIGLDFLKYLCKIFGTPLFLFFCIYFIGLKCSTQTMEVAWVNIVFDLAMSFTYFISSEHSVWKAYSKNLQKHFQCKLILKVYKLTSQQYGKDEKPNKKWPEEVFRIIRGW